MPQRPNTPCKHPGCPRLVPYGQSYCEEHRNLSINKRAGASARGYNSRWRKESKKFLLEHPLCEKCLEEKHLIRATVVDHIIPHRGDQELFWDKSNWQSLCKRHHDIKTMTEDRYQTYKF